MEFRTTLLLHGKTATGFEVPPDVVAALGAGKKPAVIVTINGGHSYRSTVAVMGGRSLVPLSAEHRAAAGVGAGDEMVVDLQPDTAPREVEVPADLSAALAATPDASAAFEQLSYSNKRQHVLAVEGAKAADTRQRRIDKIISTLTA